MVSGIFILAAAFASTAYAAGTVGAYGQCGGQSYTGPTQCIAGYTCVVSDSYYSQCRPGTANAGTTKATSAAASTPKASSAAAKSTSPASSGVAAGSGSVYKASFTQYGSGDTFGSGNCNVATTACGFYTYPGYSAAVSQNEFGVGPGAGAGGACGTCWKLTAETNNNGQQLSNHGNSIVVKVTNLCPAAGNPLCAQNGLGGTNSLGANLNFDLCIDSHANTALFLSLIHI